MAYTPSYDPAALRREAKKRAGTGGAGADWSSVLSFLGDIGSGIGGKAGQTTGGTLKGAAAGAPFGPIGAGAGALIGGIGSYLTGNAEQEENEASRRERERQAQLLEDKFKYEKQQGAADRGMAGLKMLAEQRNNAMTNYRRNLFTRAVSSFLGA